VRSAENESAKYAAHDTDNDTANDTANAAANSMINYTNF
jgi:hypothetical protein